LTDQQVEENQFDIVQSTNTLKKDISHLQEENTKLQMEKMGTVEINYDILFNDWIQFNFLFNNY
jgi:hypothetical protein